MIKDIHQIYNDWSQLENSKDVNARNFFNFFKEYHRGAGNVFGRIMPYLNIEEVQNFHKPGGLWRFFVKPDYSNSDDIRKSFYRFIDVLWDTWPDRMHIWYNFRNPADSRVIFEFGSGRPVRELRIMTDQNQVWIYDDANIRNGILWLKDQLPSVVAGGIFAFDNDGPRFRFKSDPITTEIIQQVNSEAEVTRELMAERSLLAFIQKNGKLLLIAVLVIAMLSAASRFLPLLKRNKPASLQ